MRIRQNVHTFSVYAADGGPDLDDDLVPEHDDDSGWFDVEVAETFDEGTRGDGSSLATGTHANHARLYRTTDGRWVWHGWSDWSSRKSWTVLSTAEANDWLVRNDYADSEIGRLFGAPGL